MENFKNYDLIIDARSEREFLQDHIPGASNFPVVNNIEYAEVGTLHRSDPMGAYKIGVQYALKNIAYYLEKDILGFNRKSKILIYCFRGGKRSRLWFDALDVIGYKVERLKGGWKAYRRWVNEELSRLPHLYQYRVLNGPTGCGKTRMLTALERNGAQVLDLEGLAMHHGSVIGAIPGQNQPTQKYFDSLLREKLSTFDADKPVWVEAESKKIGNIQLPDALISSIHQGVTISIEAPMDQRIAMWREDYAHFEADPDLLVQKLQYLRPLVGNAEIKYWESLAQSRDIPTLFERLMTSHYDVTYKRSSRRNYPHIDESPVINIDSLSIDSLMHKAKELRQRFE